MQTARLLRSTRCNHLVDQAPSSHGSLSFSQSGCRSPGKETPPWYGVALTKGGMGSGLQSRIQANQILESVLARIYAYSLDEAEQRVLDPTGHWSRLGRLPS